MSSTTDTTSTLEAVARLLDHAATQAYGHADTVAAGAFSPLYGFALDVQLAAAEAAYLIPLGATVGDEPLETDPLRLLHAAEELLRDVPITIPGVSRLVVTICDLIREAAW